LRHSDGSLFLGSTTSLFRLDCSRGGEWSCGPREGQGRVRREDSAPSGGQQNQDGAVTDVACRIPLGTGDQSLYVRPGRTGWKSFVPEQARAINAGGDAGRTPSAYCRMSKECTESFGAGGHRYTTPTSLSVAGQKRIYILK